jgi:hypothetical protein
MNIIELAKQAGLDWASGWTLEDDEPNRFEAFAKLVEAAARADEREALEKIDWTALMREGSLVTWGDAQELGDRVLAAIRARGTT